jgi:hypothetical protein
MFLKRGTLFLYGPVELVSNLRNGVRKAIYRDSDGNEIGFGGPPADRDSSA